MVIFIMDEPQTTAQRLNHFGIGCVFHFPSIVGTPKLEAPDFFTLYDSVRNIAHEFIDVLETLG